MGSINLYKIDSEYISDFYLNLLDKYDEVGNEVRNINNCKYRITLYYRDKKINKKLSWQWVLDEFNLEKVDKISDPTAIIVIEDNIETYAVTFGSAYFVADKFCDVDFAFNFIRRVELEEIKTTTLTTPSSHKNKSVNTFVNYGELEFESGEAFAKIKATIKGDNLAGVCKKTIEVGHSIKGVLVKESIEGILEFIDYIKVFKRKKEINHIPLFNIVRDKKVIKELEEELLENIDCEIDKVAISELEIVGTVETFNTSDDIYEIQYGRQKPVEINGISNKDIIQYISKNNLDLKSTFLEVSVSRIVNGVSYDRKKVKDLLDYTNDEKRCLLLRGKWYCYNDDYIEYLHSEISRIPVFYDGTLDFSDDRKKEYLDDKYNEVRESIEYLGMTEKEIRYKLNKDNYAEAAFNNYLGDKCGFNVYDKKLYKVGNADVELMDLYKDETMFCVKKGNASSKLCYVVDQAMNALETYDKGLIKEVPQIKKVAIWLILQRKTKLECDTNGQPNICELNMIGLKNKLVQWSKKTRLMGYEPMIYINYWS